MPKRILIVGPSWVGDTIMAQCLFKLIKAEQPDAVIDVLAPEWTHSILACMPEVNAAIMLPIGHGEFKLATRWRLAKQLKDKQYDEAIVLPNSFKSALIPWLAGIPKRTGWRGEFRYGVLNDVRVLDKNRYPLNIEQYMALGVKRGDELKQPYHYPSLTIDTAIQAEALQRLNLATDKKILAISPGAAFGSAKCWPVEHFAKVANAKLNEGWAVWLFGSANDKPVIDAINAATENRCENLAGKLVLQETVALFAKADGVLTNDSGLMHVAAALHKPIVALYGPTSPAFTPPLALAATVLRTYLDCQPCFERVCPLKHQKCMTELLPERVMAAMAGW